MIKKIVIDGNDGTGKTTRIEQLRKLFPNVEIQDRGIFSKATLDEELFGPQKRSFWFAVTPQDKFYNRIKHDHETLFIILDAEPETCQKRIAERGDSLDVEFHNIRDLEKYRSRFNLLLNICKDLPNVMLIKTDD